MNNMKKYNFWKRAGGDVADVCALMDEMRRTYIGKYYNLWMNKFEWTGLDEENANEEENFIMRKFWSDGTIAIRQHAGLLVLAPWALVTINMLDFPETVNLVNLHGASTALIPNTPQIVNKDVVVGYAMPNHKPVKSIVEPYIDRLVEIDMVINTNLNLHKMPFLIGVTEEDKKRMEDVVQRILNNETVIFTDLEDIQKIQAVATATPYVIDKLNAYRHEIENELLTFFGIDNLGVQMKSQFQGVDEINSSNQLINAYGDAIETEINKMLHDTERVLGRKISIKAKSAPVESIHEEVNKNEPQLPND